MGWTAWTVGQSREKPSADAFLAVVGTLGVWTLCSIGVTLPVGASGTMPAAILDLGALGAALFLPGVVTIYALGYTGRGTGLTWRRIAMLGGIAVPIAGGGIAIAAGQETPELERTIASMAGLELTYLFVLSVYATYLLVGHGWSHARITKRQIAVVLGGVSAPYLVSMIGTGNFAADGVSVGLLVSGGLLAFGVRRYPVTTGFPKDATVARTHVVETLQEAVFVLDWEAHVLDVNRTATTVFGRAREQVVGDPIAATVAGLEATDLSVGQTGTVTLQTTDGRRQFHYSVSAVEDPEELDPSGLEDGDSASEKLPPAGQNAVARTVLLRDVTDRRTREQRLTVLHRVLRHNVRNKVDVVLAHADQIEDDDRRAGIRESATDLVALSNTARQAESLMRRTTEPPEPIDLVAVVATVVQETRSGDRDGDLTLSCPEELTIDSHRNVLERVVSELLDNALTHSEAAVPCVDVTVERTGPDSVAITVADDGPGIPERERRLLDDGVETQLEHGQGLGLWFVSWAVHQLGGDLDFAENDPQGTVVTVTLYETGDA